ncbi:hypothetical protein GQ44DRAFT_776822 [Phaeosphaeriaceae sp. PMI808]|nr:hypothetical protein GQ44DRAFT_776822 [Phaeosphaeriaceae sp. PMI808]
MAAITTTTGSLPLFIATATVPDLTTFFTPPASCSNRWVAADTPGIAWSTYSRDGYTPPVDPIYYSCLPRSLKGPHYSPGVCTQGQTIAGITKYEAGPRTMWQAQCCKSGLTLSMQTIQGSGIPMCVSAISTPLPVRTLLTTTYTNGVRSSYYEDVINDKSTLSSITTITKGTAVADPLYVAWEASDLSLFPVAYATSLAQKIGVDFTPTGTPAASTASSRLPLETSSSTGSPSDSSGLSGTAKIGIGVGIGIGVALTCALVTMSIVIRRLRRKNHAGVAYPNENTPAMDKHDTGSVEGKWYHQGKTNAEFEQSQGPLELDSIPVQAVHVPPVELEGSQAPSKRY